MQPGEPIPAFTLPDQNGSPRAFADLTGPRGLVLFAYAKDNTSG